MAGSTASVPNRAIRSWSSGHPVAGRFGWGDEDFCAFSVDGVPFIIIEPFGDNDCYWIVAENPDPSARPFIERIRQTFAAAWG